MSSNERRFNPSPVILYSMKMWFYSRHFFKTGSGGWGSPPALLKRWHFRELLGLLFRLKVDVRILDIFLQVPLRCFSFLTFTFRKMKQWA